ncbi:MULTISPECIES: HPr family phosphocarrier protein [Novosphingobium]|uniref:HPr family phosphocarrier protein n=1 Tax=Novosphingobium decolorationis TaxID=2698673 RepID=A0ABX8E1R1_9SPHN|nr:MULTISPECIES: HPr family phosphocarrier protein [Novosphingobium]MED5545572.1 HPr family phosphocarrier protein [Pseudomonadota bacterium]QVM82889.1 HPr family phosphocarrier protein [Novosphingobium decolorationis]GAM06425.1 phosphocarrier protein [Novosphingobium sp. MBES04]
MNDCRETVTIVNKRGLHARASAKFVNYVTELPASVSVSVSKDGASAVGNSILGLMMLGAAKGDSIEIACTGDDAQSALDRLVALVRDGFGEDQG